MLTRIFFYFMINPFVLKYFWRWECSHWIWNLNEKGFFTSNELFECIELNADFKRITHLGFSLDLLSRRNAVNKSLDVSKSQTFRHFKAETNEPNRKSIPLLLFIPMNNSSGIFKRHQDIGARLGKSEHKLSIAFNWICELLRQIMFDSPRRTEFMNVLTKVGNGRPVCVGESGN